MEIPTLCDSQRHLVISLVPSHLVKAVCCVRFVTILGATCVGRGKVQVHRACFVSCLSLYRKKPTLFPSRKGKAGQCVCDCGHRESLERDPFPRLTSSPGAESLCIRTARTAAARAGALGDHSALYLAVRKRDSALHNAT